MLLNEYIGFDPENPTAPFIDSSQFVKELLWLDTLGKKKIEVWINSPGGVMMDAMEIYHAILATKTPVDTKCVGIAASAAAEIFEAGRKRIMTSYGQLMFHNPSGGDRKGLAAMKESIVKMIASRCGQSEDAIGKIMDRTTFILSSDTEYSYLWDAVEDAADLNKAKPYAEVNEAIVRTTWNHYNNILNSTIKKKVPC